MSIYLPECNAQVTGSGGAVSLALPAGASFKAANVGFVTGIFVRTPSGGYENNVAYNVLSRGLGGTGGNDGFLQFNQSGNTLTASLRSSGTQILPNTAVASIPQASTLLVMLIATAANVHVAVCVPGSAPLITSVANTLCYSTNLSASDVWARIGAGTGASPANAHYGPVEEAFFIRGLFPETSGVPDTTLIQNIASGVQSIATLDTLLSGTISKRWNYRMLQQDALTDAFGVAAALTGVNTTVDKVLLSSGPLRPVALAPAFGRASCSQVRFGTPGVTATATADIKTEAGTYSGITPAAIHARLRKEDASVLVNWQVVDAAPAGGVWAASQFTAVPMTAGELTVDYKAVDGGGAQLGDIVSSHGIKGTGFNVLGCSQSQGMYLFETGGGVAIPAEMRSQMSYMVGSTYRQKRLSSINTNSRVGRGMRRAAMEIHALFPGFPIHFATVGVSGQPIGEFIGAGSFAGNWAAMKTFLGTVQPYALYPMGHSTNADANYETNLNSLVAKATADVGAPIGILHAATPRYAGAGTGGNFTQVEFARTGIRNRVANNPSTDYFAASPQVVKNDTGDTGPHPMDADVGHGRSGALYAWGLMMWARAVEDEPITLTGAVKQAGGTQHKLVFGPVNAVAAITLSAGAGAFALTGGGIAPVPAALFAGAGAVALTGGGIAFPIGGQSARRTATAATSRNGGVISRG